MDPIAGLSLSPTDTLLVSFFFFFFWQKVQSYSPNVQIEKMYKLHYKNKQKPTELIVKNKPALVTEVNSFYLLFLLKV